MAARWEEMETWLTQHQGQWFNAVGLGVDLGVPTTEASEMINAYQHAQRHGRPTRFVIQRRGRTRNATWRTGSRTADVRTRREQFKDDLSCTVYRALVPDLYRMGLLNHQAEPVVEATVNALVATLEMMAAGFNGGSNGSNTP